MQLTTDQSINDKIYIEQIKIMHDAIPLLLFVNFMIGLALSYGFSDVVPWQSIMFCMTLLLAMVIIRGLIYFKLRDQFDENNLVPHKLSVIVGSIVAGLIWGAISILYFPVADQNYQLFLLISLMAMTGGSTFTYSIYMPGYFSYVPSILLPIAVQFFLLGDKFHNTLGIVTIVYLLVLTAFNLRLNKSFKATLALRFENLNLIEQLKEQKEEAERANKAKSKFLAAASHDLRQPLYALGLFTSVLDEIIKYPEVKRVVEQINTSVAALTNLFDKLLDISQLDAGVIQVKKQDFSLEQMFKEMASEFNREAQEKGINISWPSHYPSVNSEPELLERILRNYLSNAIKYTNQGTIKVNFNVENNLIKIDVSDSGIGISEDALCDIYEEFYQVSNPEGDRLKGLGLGLSIVKRTARLLEHQIDVTSTLGQGSTFSISVQQAKDRAIETAPSNELNSEIDSGEKLILVIDDEASIREGLASILALWHYQVIAVGDLDEAIVQLNKSQRMPDIIISDYRLRENKTGIDAINTIHQLTNKQIPALLITGDMAPDRLVAMKKSNLPILFKPVATMKLRSFLLSVDQS